LRFGDDVRWCDAWGRWLVWDGKRWKVDDTCRAEALAKKVAKGLWKEAGDAGPTLTNPEMNKVHSFCRSSNGANGVKNMLAMARSEPSIPVVVKQMDRDPWLLNCENGTLDLRTGELHSHE